MTDQSFIEFVKKECQYYGVKHSLRNSEYCIYDGQPVSGCFDDETMILVCAMRRHDYLGILAHEYCHMTQWAEKAPVWMAAKEAKSYEAWNEHMAGADIDMDNHFQIMRDLELDNEKRTARLIRKFSLDIDIKQYVKKANAYVMLYNFMRITGKWPHPKNSPYNNPVILAAMPDRFSFDYSKMPARIERLYISEGIGGHRPK